MLVSAVAKHAPELVELGLEQREARTGRQPSSRLPPSATARRASRRWMAARASNSGQWRAPGAVRPLSRTPEPAGRSRQATSTAVPARRATQATPCRGRGDNPTTTLTPAHRMTAPADSSGLLSRGWFRDEAPAQTNRPLPQLRPMQMLANAKERTDRRKSKTQMRHTGAHLPEKSAAAGC